MNKFQVVCLIIAVIMFFCAVAGAFVTPSVEGIERMKWEIVIYRVLIGIYAYALAVANL